MTTNEEKYLLDAAPMMVVRGGGFTLLTNDVILISVVRRCAALESQLREAHFQEISRYRTLRRDVTQIKRKVCSK